MSVSDSDWAMKLAFGVQYSRQASQPFPASHASKNYLATAVMLDICCFSLPFL
jgi:hypothetical protein